MSLLTRGTRIPSGTRVLGSLNTIKARTYQQNYYLYTNRCTNEYRKFSHLNCVRDGSFPRLLYQKNKQLHRDLQNYSPIIQQSCSYHSLIGTRNHMGRKDILGRPLYGQQVIAAAPPKRDLSLAWLDSLAVTQAGWFQALAKSQLVEVLMSGLQGFHDYTHLPWWASIMLSTVLMRGLLTFPLSVYQQYIMAKVENLKPEMVELVKELKMEVAFAVKKFGWEHKQARTIFNRSARKMWRELILRENCHPFKATLLLWIQIPLWVSMSMSFRNLASMMPHHDAAAHVVFMELSTGGIAWIPNLTDVDHSLILPVVMGITNLIITEVTVLSRVQQQGSKLQTVATNLFRCLSVALVPIAATVPSCVLVYWVTSSVCALTQNLVLLHPGVRRACGVPDTPSMRLHPYRHLWQELERKLSRRKKEKEEEMGGEGGEMKIR